MCRDTSRGRHSRRLACLRSHVLRAYCNFESKQAICLGDAQIIRRATSAQRPGVGFEVRTSCIHTTKFYALELGKLSYISIHDHVMYTEFLLLHVFFIFFRDLNFLCGLYGYKISRECLFAESLISKILFLQSRKTLKNHIIKCQYGLNK